MSVITIAELTAGVRDGTERQQLDDFIEVFEVLALPKEFVVVAGV